MGVPPVIDRAELQYQAMVLLSRLVKFNDTWLSSQAQLVKQLLDIWTSDAFVLRHAKVVSHTPDLWWWGFGWVAGGGGVSPIFTGYYEYCFLRIDGSFLCVAPCCVGNGSSLKRSVRKSH